MFIALPYPPTLNTYWRHVGYQTLLSRDGRIFRERVCRLLGGGGARKPPKGRIALAMDAFPPDRRRRDLDNIQKPVIDALEHAGIYLDDSQIDLLVTRRCEVTPKGKILVMVEGLPLRYCLLCGRPMGLPEREV